MGESAKGRTSFPQRMSLVFFWDSVKFQGSDMDCAPGWVPASASRDSVLSTWNGAKLCFKQKEAVFSCICAHICKHDHFICFCLLRSEAGQKAELNS